MANIQTLKAVFKLKLGSFFQEHVDKQSYSQPPRYVYCSIYVGLRLGPVPDRGPISTTGVDFIPTMGVP